MKRFVILALVCVAFLPLVVAGAPELIFQHNETQPGETMLGVISVDGEWVQGPAKSTISFFEDRKEIFMEFDVVFFEENYYLYAYPENEGEYSVVVSDLLYNEEDILKSSEIEYFFTVETSMINNSNGTMIDQRLGIKPGFLLVPEGDEILLLNKGNDALEVTYGEEIILLEPFSSTSVVASSNELFSEAVFSTYKEFRIPLINLLGNETNTTSEFTPLNLKADTEFITANLSLGNDLLIDVTLFNFDDNNLSGISFSSTLDIFDFPNLDLLTAREEKEVEIEINPENPGRITDEILVSYIELGEMHVLKIPVDLFVYPAGTLEEEFGIVESTCEELSGVVCGANEVCTGDATFASGGVYCCLEICGEIVEEESDSSTGMIIGIVILLVLFVVGYWLWKRSKKVKSVDSKEVLEEASKKYDMKMKGSVASKKVSGKVEKG